MPDLFLSYSREDAELAVRVGEALVANDVSVWLDEWELLAGESVTRGIARGIDESQFVGVILTERSVQSGWVSAEWAAKFRPNDEGARERILPILARDCGVPTLLADRKPADLRFDFDAGISEIVRSVKRRRGPHSRPTPDASPDRGGLVIAGCSVDSYRGDYTALIDVLVVNRASRSCIVSKARLVLVELSVVEVLGHLRPSATYDIDISGLTQAGDVVECPMTLGLVADEMDRFLIRVAADALPEKGFCRWTLRLELVTTEGTIQAPEPIRVMLPWDTDVGFDPPPS